MAYGETGPEFAGALAELKAIEVERLEALEAVCTALESQLCPERRWIRPASKDYGDRLETILARLHLLLVRVATPVQNVRV